MQTFPATDVNDLRVGGRDDDSANRSSGLLVENWLPGASIIRRLPDASVDCADVENIRLAGNARCSASASTTKRADVAPMHLGECLGVEVLGLGMVDDGNRKEQEGEKYEFQAHGHPHIEICTDGSSYFMFRHGEV